MTETAYSKLFEHSKKIKTLNGISYLLEWDQETYMPEGGAAPRAEQIELLASLVHKEQTSKSYESALSKLIDLDKGKIKVHGLSSLQQIAIERWRRDFLIATAVPNSFVKAFAKLTSNAMMAWKDARDNNQFSIFAPFLEQVVAMSREKAELLGYKKTPYDALLDFYEPDCSTAEIDTLFSKLKPKIVSLLRKIEGSKQFDNTFLHGSFSEIKQLKFGKELLAAMGYDLKNGRLDLSTHPFSTALHPHDSRITTRIHKSSVFDCISAVMHEGGHGLYEMGLPTEYYGSPLSESVSLGIHESQSRFWETRIGQSRPFWQHFLPRLKKTMGGKLESVSLDRFYRGINRVTPTFIRVEADEVTYSLHVILRFELEKMLIEGDLAVTDLPSAWNEKMEDLLGITPPSDDLGCLQDIHWSMGAIGYFPTYTLGNLYAATFFNAFAKEHPDYEKRIAKGDLLFIRDWMKEKIHRHGRVYTASELAKNISGKPLTINPYVTYLENKYRDIYHF